VIKGVLQIANHVMKEKFVHLGLTGVTSVIVLSLAVMEQNQELEHATVVTLETLVVKET